MTVDLRMDAALGECLMEAQKEKRVRQITVDETGDRLRYILTFEDDSTYELTTRAFS